MKKIIPGGGLYKRKIKYITSLIITVVGLLSLIVGTSYAILKGETDSKNEQVIKAGSVELELSEYYESMNKGIEVKEDKDGLLGEPYKFSIKNIGSEVAKYDVKLVNEETTENKILDKYIKIGLEVNGEEMGPMNIGDVKNIIDSNIINEKEIINYSLRIWLDKEHEEEIEQIEDAKAILKIQVEAKQREYEENLDKSGANKPVLSDSMIPVYYDSKKDVWRKADKDNKIESYKWYDYNNKMWANSVTYDHTKAYNEGKTIEGKEFNGTSDYIDMGYAKRELGDKLTVISRFKIDEQEDQYLIGNAENSGFGLQIYKNKIGISIYNGSGYTATYLSELVEANKWYTVVAVFDGTLENDNIKVYVNGNLEITNTLKSSLVQSSYPITIGVNPGSKYEDYFQGTMSDAIVLTEVIDENTIKERYSGEVNHKDRENQLFYAKFDNGNEIINGAQYTKDGMTFDGTNDYVNLGLSNYDLGNQITVAAKFKISSLNSSDANLHIISNAEDAGFYIAHNKNNKIELAIYNGSKYITLLSKATIEQDKWYTVVGTYDGTLTDKQNLKLYINGELQGTKEETENITSSTVPITIGANPNKSNHRGYFNGTISDTLLVGSTLTGEQAKRLSKDDNFKDYSDTDNTLIYNNLRSYETRENGTEVPMDMISTMEVWIPRYKYKVWNYNENGDKTSEPQTIEITFEKGNKSTGDITCEDNIQGEGGNGKSETCTLKNTKAECTDATCKDKTYTHPGFTFGEEELTGFWVGKFELSSDTVCTPTDDATLGNNCNLETISPLIKPNLYSWRGAQISTFETVAFAMKNTGNKYGFNDKDDTHIIKNSEWGAVAYLSHSKYGKDREVENNANSIYITGCGPQPKESSETTTICNSYETDLGQSASTTGNIYGVYDMAGGAWDVAMLNIIGNDGESKMSGYSEKSNSGYKGKLYNGTTYTDYTTGKDYPKEKYYEQISFGTTYNDSSAIKRGKLGEMIRETKSWNKDSADNAYSTHPWLCLGNQSSGKLSAGVFAFTNTYGRASTPISSRLVISNIN